MKELILIILLLFILYKFKENIIKENLNEEELNLLGEESQLVEEEENKLYEYKDIQDEEEYYITGGYDSLFMNLKMSPNYFSFSERDIFLERSMSINLFNYLLNFCPDSPINFTYNSNKNLRTYLIELKFIYNLFKTEFITDANEFINVVISKLNKYFNEKFGNKIDINKETLVKDYKENILNCYRDDFVEKIRDKVIEESKFLSSFFFLNELFNLLTIEMLFFNNNKRVSFNIAAIDFLVNLNLIQNVTIRDYDNFDIILNAIDNYLRDYCLKTFNKKYDNIIYFKLGEVRNIFYSGNKEDFNFSFV